MEELQVTKTAVAGECAEFQTAEIAVDAEITLPDFKPDIMRVLKCRAQPMLNAKQLSGGTLTADGVILLTVLYVDADNRLNAFEQSVAFAKSLAIQAENPAGTVCADVRMNYLNCRAITARRLDLHGTARLSAQICLSQSTEILSSAEGGCVELRIEPLEISAAVHTAEKTVTVEEEFDLGNAMPDIETLLSYDVCPHLKESRQLGEKNIVKGELAITALYADIEGGLQQARTVLPFSALLELPGVSENCVLDTAVSLNNYLLQVRATAEGAPHGFLLSAKLSLCSKGYCNENVEIVTDAYSRCCAVDVQSRSLKLNRVIQSAAQSQSLQEKLSFPAGGLTRVVYLWAEASVTEIRRENDLFSVSGNVTANILGFDENDVPVFYERPIAFHQTVAADGADSLQNAAITVCVESYTLMAENGLLLQCGVDLTGILCQTVNCSAVTELALLCDRPLPAKVGAMMIYYADPGERLWDIAKRYFASTADLKAVNDLPDILTDSAVVYIPLS